MPPRLTIAIPTLNRANLLGRAIGSALAQTSPDIEIIVSDNASIDDTAAVLKQYEGRGVRVFRQAQTIPASRNGEFLINQARGEFFLGLSDDDYLEPEFATKVLALYDRHPELSFVYTGCVFHYEDCQVPVEVGPPIESGPDFIAAHFSGKRVVAWCACVSRVRDLREVGPQPDERVIGDMFFWTKLAYRGPIGCVPGVLSHYIHLRSADLNDNISHGVPAPAWAHECRLLADEVLAASRVAGQSDAYIEQLKQATRHHIARSTANQFVWSRVRGASIRQAWRWVPACMPYLTMSSKVVSRIGAALTLPRSALRHLLMKNARKLAVSGSLAAKANG